MVHPTPESKQNIYMKGVFIAFDQAHKEAVIGALDRLNCRGFSFIEQLQGRGSKTGEPHYGTHAWPSMAGSIITIVDDNKVDNILKEIKDDKSSTGGNGDIRKVITYKNSGERYGKPFGYAVSDLCRFTSALCRAAKANFI